MEKGNVDADRFQEKSNNSFVADGMYINGQSGSRSKKNVKMTTKRVKLRTKKGLNTKIQIENGVRGTSTLKRLDTSQSKMKKKKKTKIESPMIVEDTVGECPTIRIPAVLRHAVVDKSVASTSRSLEPFGVGEKKNRDRKINKAKVRIVECTNPVALEQNNSSDSQSRVQEEAPETVEEKFEEISATNSSHDFSIVTKKKSMIRIEPMEEEDSGRINRATEENSAMDEAKTPCRNGYLQETEKKQLPRFYSLRNKVLAIVEPYGNFSFHGKLRIRVLYGAVRIYGASFNSTNTQTPVAVYAPRPYSPVGIEAVESEIDNRNIDHLWESLAEQCAERKFAKRLQSDINNLEDGWAVVELENFENQLTNFLAIYSPYHLFPRVEDPSNHSWRDARRAEIVLQANLRFVDSSKQLTIGSRGIDDFADGISYDWDTKAASRTVIAGGKAVGKSTTMRYLVNKLLSKSKAVVVLDLDPGQAEFTPAGSISLNVVEEPLLGPNFTHLKTPHYQLYVGSADVTRCFTHYIDGIKKLTDRIHEDPKLMHLPLVVNTMGFCKGIGWDIISYIIKLVSPTDVVQILSRRLKNNFADTLSRQVIDRQSLGSMNWTKDTINKVKPAKHRLHVIYSEAETRTGNADSWNLENHQQRELVLLAYLSEIVRKDAASFALSQRTLIPSINSVVPYAVPFSAISVSLAGALIPQVLSVMNGNIVALCGINQDLESTNESNDQDDIAAFYPRVLIRPPLSTCYGFGILRGIDMEMEQLFVNTPLSPDEMQHVNCLIGCVNLPPSLLELSQQGAPYTGSEYDLPTSRGSRRGYYRMRYRVNT